MIANEDELMSESHALIEEAKELLLKAEDGDLCLDKLKDLSDRGFRIMKKGEADSKILHLMMLDVSLMEVVIKIFQLNVRTLSPNDFVFDPVLHAHKFLNYFDLASMPKTGGQIADALVSHLSPVAARIFSNRSCSLSVLSGALEITDPEKKARAAHQRLPKDKVEPLKEAEKLAMVSGQTVEKTLMEIKHQLKKAYIANKEAPICYMKFVLHPTSFAKTVENIFHVSFLVSKSNAVIFLDKEQNPWIKPMPKNCPAISRDDTSALVMGITRDEWREAVRLYGIEEPMIKLEEVEVPRTVPGNYKRKKPATQV